MGHDRKITRPFVRHPGDLQKTLRSATEGTLSPALRYKEVEQTAWQEDPGKTEEAHGTVAVVTIEKFIGGIAGERHSNIILCKGAKLRERQQGRICIRFAGLAD